MAHPTLPEAGPAGSPDALLQKENQAEAGAEAAGAQGLWINKTYQPPM